MQDCINKAVLKCFGIQPKSIRALGGGFYGRVFMAVLDREPFQIVIKLYLFPHIAVGEARQIETLSQYALLKMPRIYQVLEKEQTGLSHDVLFMEYIEGVNAGNFDVSELSESSRTAICEDIVDTLSVQGDTRPKP